MLKPRHSSKPVDSKSRQTVILDGRALISPHTPLARAVVMGNAPSSIDESNNILHMRAQPRREPPRMSNLSVLLSEQEERERDRTISQPTNTELPPRPAESVSSTPVDEADSASGPHTAPLGSSAPGNLIRSAAALLPSNYAITRHNSSVGVAVLPPAAVVRTTSDKMRK
jgi:hypothetical protein